MIEKKEMIFYAHSLEGKPVDNWQRLEDHLKSVAEMASRFARAFSSADWAWNAAILHDIGKIDASFQVYLFRSNGFTDVDYDTDGQGKVNHSSAGAACAEESFPMPLGRALAYLIAGHHAGLPDYHSHKTGAAALSIRLAEGRANLGRIKEKLPKLLAELKGPLTTPAYLKSVGFHLWLRMLFSCLVDADFLDTEAFMSPDRHKIRCDTFRQIPELKSRFDTYMKDKQVKAEPTPVNAIRQQILTACRDISRENPGLYSLTVPTGGGKTLSGLAFALEHAVTHAKNRIIYVIPYTSIIEQTAKEFRQIFGNDQVVEHHSNLEADKETPQAMAAAENWDAPIIVTTNVQFFESLYACKSSRCRKLHNLVESVVVLDEAQLIPPRWLVPCVEALNHLTRDYGATILLTTATQPALPGITTPREIVSDRNRLYSDLIRTEIRMPKDFSMRTDWNSLASELSRHDQVLCIVNTRRDCYELFKTMPEGTIHLSALMCGAHRSRIIDGIKKKLKDGVPLRVISTQLVEAGVDIDFPVVYRALAGLDSIAQAAGRCNREGKLNQQGRLGLVQVFVPPKQAPQGLLRKGEDTCITQAQRADFDSQQPEEYTRYFEQFYAKLNDDGAKWLQENLYLQNEFSLNLRTAGKEFKLIDDQSRQSILVKETASKPLLDKLRKEGPSRGLLRRLQRYSVNLSQRDFQKAQSFGMVEEISTGYWLWLGTYSEVYGLDIFGSGWAAEDTIV